MGTKNTEYKNSYNKDNYSRIALYFPKDFKESISDYCNAADVPMAEFIKDLVYEKIGDYFDDCITEEYVRVQIYSLSSVMISWRTIFQRKSPMSGHSIYGKK